MADFEENPLKTAYSAGKHRYTGKLSKFFLYFYFFQNYSLYPIFIPTIPKINTIYIIILFFKEKKYVPMLEPHK